MNLWDLVSVKLAICLVIGILLGKYLPIDPYFAVVLVIALILILGLLFNRTRPWASTFGGLAGFTTIAIGMLSMSLSVPQNHSDHYTHQAYQNQHTWHLKIRKVLKSGTFSDRYIAVLKGMDSIEVSGKLILYSIPDAAHKAFKVDDELWVHAALKTNKAPLNPYQFNYRKYLEGLGIFHRINLSTTNYLVVGVPTATVYGLSEKFRKKIISRLRGANFGEEELSIMEALLLGQRNAISEATYTNYINAGAVHILALSGLHIGIVLIVLQFLLSPLERLPAGKTIKFIAIVLLLWGYAFIAGLSASIIRAVTMFSFLAYAMCLNRPTNTHNILALSLFFILLAEPMLLFQIGFQMSYAAVFAIVWIYPILYKLWIPKAWILKKGWQLLVVSIAAQIGVLPISLLYFHQFPGLFFVSNLLIIPFLGILLGAGILVIAMALLNILPHFLAEWYGGAIDTMNTVIKWIAHHEAFIFRDIPFDIPKLLLSYCLIIGTLLILTKVTYKRVVFVLASIIGFQISALYRLHSTLQTEKLIVLHQSRNTVLFHQYGNQLTILGPDASQTAPLVRNYKIAENIEKVHYQPLKKGYLLNKKRLVILDSLPGYPPLDQQPDYVLLTHSPKINLVRFIDSVRPKSIIADGSNYKSYIERWGKTCRRVKIPFYDTGESGFYTLYSR